MSIQKDQVEGAETGADDSAEFSGAWDELDAAETGQPSLDEGRQDTEVDELDQEGDEAGQGANDATPDADAGSASRDETSDDLWANAPQALREAYEAERVARGKAENLVRSNGGRLAQAYNELNALKAKLASDRDEGGATEKGEEASTREDRLKQLREEYPDVAAPILDQMANLEASVNELKQAQTSQTEAQATDFYREQRDALVSRHTDFDQVVASPEYRDWLGQQPQLVQRVIAENAARIVNAEDCAFVIDRFKAETGYGGGQAEAEQLAQKRGRQLNAGTGVRRVQPQVTRDEGSGTFEDEWDRLDRLERQRAATRR